MDDFPRRVNAAQLAARKIKTGTGAKKRLANHISTVDLNAAPQWADPNATSTPSGLFGGSVSASGSFNFSAPGPSVSFGPTLGSEAPKFTPIQIRNSEEKRKANATDEVVDRRNKPFQIAPMSAIGVLPESSQPSKTTNNMAEEVESRNKPFKMPSMLGDTTRPDSTKPSSNPFLSIPLPAKDSTNGVSNPFQIHQIQQSAQSPLSISKFNYGATSLDSHDQTQQTQSPSNSFNFGLASQSNSASIISLDQNAVVQPMNTGVSGNPTPALSNLSGSIVSLGQALSQPSSSGSSPNPTPALAPPQNVFGQTQSLSSSGVNFNPASSPSQPLKIFGQLSAQSSSSGISFNSITAPAQSQNVFSEAQQPSTQPTYKFGQFNQQITPTSNIFSNMQSPTPNVNNIFGALGQQQPSNSPLSFGKKAQETTAIPTTTSFSANGEKQALSSTSSVFSNQPQKSIATSSLFDIESQQKELANPFRSKQTPFVSQENKYESQQRQQEKSAASPNSIFGATQSASNLFTGQKSAASPNSIFGATQSTSKLFTGEKVGPASNNLENQIVSTAANSISGNIFGQLGSVSQNVNEQPSNMVNSDPATMVGAELTNTNIIPEIPPSPKPAFSFLQTSTPASKPPILAFGHSILSNGASEPTGHLDASLGPPGEPTTLPKLSKIPPPKPATNMPEDETHSGGDSTFPALHKPEFSTLKDNIFAISNAAKVSSQNMSNSTNGVSTSMPGTEEPKGSEQEMWEWETLDQTIERKCPPNFTEKQRIQFFALYRLRALNKGFLLACRELPTAGDFGPSCKHYMERRDEILEICKTDLHELSQGVSGSESLEAPKQSNKRSIPFEGADISQDTDEGQRKRAKLLQSSPFGKQVPKTSSPLKTQPVINRDQLEHSPSSETENPNKSISPSKSKPLSLANGSTTPIGPPPATTFGPHSAPPLSPTPKSKRKAEVQLTPGDTTGDGGDEGDLRRKKITKLDKSAGGSETSNIFRSILDGPSQSSASMGRRPGSPEKRILSPRKSSCTTGASRPNPFSSLPSPSPGPSNPSASSISTFKPAFQPTVSYSRADDSETRLSSYSDLKPTSIEAPANQLSPATSASSVLAAEHVPAETSMNSNSGTQKPGLFNTSLFVKKSASDQTLPESGTASASSASIFSTKPSLGILSSNPFVPGATRSSVFSSKSVVTSSTNVFGARTAPTISVSADTPSLSPETNNVTKPPAIGSTPTNFLAQFSSKSQKNLEDIEAKAMERAKLEELDSDDDVDEWEAKWREKRAAEKKALESVKHATFVPGKGFTLASTQDVNDAMPYTETAGAIPKPVSTQNSTAPSASNVITSVNGSTASSPGAASSTTSSVFDNIPPKKPITFSANIFGHLSDADSGASSGQDNDADDDHTGEDNGDNEEDGSSESNEDLERNDTTYEPNRDEGSGSSSPATPPEETGPGIASAKKSVNFLGTVSGTSTPTLSIWDRITKDSNGNPIRQVPIDDKENTEPTGANAYNGNGTNIFAQLANSSKSPGDNTWKPESPIKFGTSTPPSVSITAPTPTKTNSFAGFFNNAAVSSSTPTAPAPASPFAGLFGHNSTPKQSPLFPNLSNPDSKSNPVGFTFGAASTAASSLLPSVAGSSATSRATSPGLTTDGETTSEAANDHDPEHQKQINLTAGGPGEENEEVLLEVRAKALKHTVDKDANGGPWSTKGIGPLRILKHKETGATRVLLRADPSGSVVFNKGILAQIKYEAIGKTVKVLCAADDGTGLETWVLQVKTPETAKKLATTLELNKPEG